MIFKALKTISLDSSTGSMTVHDGDLFRSESSAIVTAGFARKLTKAENAEVLAEYARFADDLFNTPIDKPVNKAKGNMYTWVTEQYTHIGGRCPHECSYCWVGSIRGGRPAKYQGEPRLIDRELMKKYGSGKTIFVEHCNDLFAASVPNEWIAKVLAHCRRYPRNTYVFQTKNPERYHSIEGFPPDCIFGTTIETNRNMKDISKAPYPKNRKDAMVRITGRKFVTIEPILDFDLEILFSWIAEIRPDFVNIGADSKAHHLPEPTAEKIYELITALNRRGIEVRRKTNLERLMRAGSN